MPKGVTNKGQDSQNHRRGNRGKPPETVKNPQFKRNKQLISPILKQNMNAFYDEPML